MVAWAVAVRRAFRTRRISELNGRAICAPLLALTLGAQRRRGGGDRVAGPSWRGRRGRVPSTWTIAGPIGFVVILSGVAQIAIYGRLLYVGLSRLSDAVRAGEGERLDLAGVVARREVVGLSRAERAFERGGHAVGGVLDAPWACRRRSVQPGDTAGVLALSVAGLGFHGRSRRPWCR